MTPKGVKAKGRRLQAAVAEQLAVTFGLTIEAAGPTKPGTRASGAVYVPEGQAPDLRVRQMGQAGADVALLTEKARELVRLPMRDPIWFEAKNTEEWALDAGFWRSHALPAFAMHAYTQAVTACKGAWTPVVVLGKNNHEPLALWENTALERDAFIQRSVLLLTGQGWAICRFDQFVRALFEWRESSRRKEAA